MMEFLEIAARRYARFPRLAREPGLAHAFATRPADVSARTDADSPRRDARRKQMAVDLGFDPLALAWCVQVHEPRLEAVTEGSPAGPYEQRDGLVTALIGKPLMTFSADCPLVLAYDPVRRVVGMAHASWRCTVAAMSRRLVEFMRQHYACRPEQMLAGIGPSAGPCCYEVKQDVYDAARDLRDRDRFFPRRAAQLYFDLWGANAAQLVDVGLPRESIETAGICTMCRNEVFYSFRREGPGCGHFGLLAGLIEQ